MKKLILQVLNILRDRLTEPGDTEAIVIRKSTLALAIIITILTSVIWSIFLINIGLVRSTQINIVYGIIQALYLILYFRIKNNTVFLNVVFGTGLVYILAIQTSLGGFINSGGSLIIGALLPMISGIILSRRATIVWGIIYLLTLGVSYIYEPVVIENAPDLLGSFNSAVSGYFTIVTLVVISTTIILYLRQKFEEAQDRADILLLNILPRKIADKLKETPGTIAEGYEAASILFADIVGFTPLSEKLSPVAMIELLNKIYSHFDALVEKCGVEKIRTIGDNYMVASGVPTPREDHAEALAHVALDMLAFLEKLEPIGDTKLNLRIGINSGPLTAGVIGTKKFHYDVWGDAVNTASRMESHGIPGKVQITQNTYELLKNEFELEARGMIAVKGKGEMDTWFVVGRKD